MLRQLSDPEASLRIATHRTDVKKQMKESKTELSKVKKESEDLKNALLELEQQVQEKDRLIASLKRTNRSLEGHRMDKLFLIEQMGGVEKFLDVFPIVRLPSTKKQDQKLKELNTWFIKASIEAMEMPRKYQVVKKPDEWHITNPRYTIGVSIKYK